MCHGCGLDTVAAQDAGCGAAGKSLALQTVHPMVEERWRQRPGLATPTTAPGSQVSHEREGPNMEAMIARGVIGDSAPALPDILRSLRAATGFEEVERVDRTQGLQDEWRRSRRGDRNTPKRDEDRQL